MPASKAYKIAKEAMESGNNCCEAILFAFSNVWGIPLADDTIAAATLFEEGMQDGCICGALVGMVMASGILSKRYRHPLGKQLPKHLVMRFKKEFGSTCCQNIKNKQPVWQRVGKRACIGLAARAAEIMVEEWVGVGNASQDICNNSHIE